jgi:E3 ubiquitin-protein ligase MARCH6
VYCILYQFRFQKECWCQVLCNLQEMIHLPIVRHVRRLLASAVIFGTAVLLMLWLPVRILRVVWPSFLPYTVALQSEAQVNELSLELLLLQVSVSKEPFHNVQDFSTLLTFIIIVHLILLLLLGLNCILSQFMVI